MKTIEKKILETFSKNSGDAGYRSPYLSHAKRALYHLSYIPILMRFKCVYISYF